MPKKTLLKFVFLEYRDKGGSGGVGVNQTLVKVMFQCAERANNGSVNPSPFHHALTPSRGLYRTQSGEDERPGLFFNSVWH